MTDLGALLHQAADAAPAPGDLLAGVVRVEHRQTRRRRLGAVLASAAAVAVIAGGTAYWQRPGIRSASSAAAAEKVPPAGTHLPGKPYGVSLGRAVPPSDDDLGLVATPATPRLTMAEAYRLFLRGDKPLSLGGLHPGVAPAVVTQPGHGLVAGALVWVVWWTGVTCLPAGPAHNGGGAPPRAQVCDVWVVLSDATGKVVISGDGTASAKPAPTTPVAGVPTAS